MQRILGALVLTSLAACATEEVIPSYPEGFGTPENPIPHEDAYVVRTRVTSAVDATQVASVVADLRAMALNPARTLIAEVASQPAWQQLLADLPTTLDDRLEGWINTEIDKARIGGKTLRQYAGDMATMAETALTQFTLESSLSISPTGASHSLTALNFTPSSLDIVIPIGGLKADTIAQNTDATVGEGGALVVGDQEFGLAFGDHAWQAINLASSTLYAGDLRTTLVTALDCRVLAQTVATKCYSSSCVGHTAQIQTACEAAADAIIGELRTRIPQFKLDVVHFIQGTARLVDDNGDGIADRIIDGTWDAEVTAGAGLRVMSPTFTALIKRER